MEVEKLFKAIQETQASRRRQPIAWCRSASSCCSKGCARGARRVLRGGHTPAQRISRQSVLDRSGAGLRRPGAATRVTLETLSEMLAETDARTLRQFLTTHFRRRGQRRCRKDSERSRAGQSGQPRQAQGGRNHQAARGHAEREPGRRAEHVGAAVCQPCAAAVSARRVCDHASRS